MSSSIRPENQSGLSSFADGRILNIDKPGGWTSFDVVKKVRVLTKIKKVGHAGTLDPFATGVLLVCTGRATKRVSELMSQKKEYVATIEFGKETDTYDCTGAVVSENPVDSKQLASLPDVCAREFTGEIAQVPPMYSAVKKKGLRLYKLARQGMTVPRDARRVAIYELEVVDMAGVNAVLRIVCSKGTYIRTLAHDLGNRLGCGAHLSALRRTRIGSYTIDDALSLAQLSKRPEFSPA